MDRDLNAPAKSLQRGGPCAATEIRVHRLGNGKNGRLAVPPVPIRNALEVLDPSHRVLGMHAAGQIT